MNEAKEPIVQFLSSNEPAANQPMHWVKSGTGI